MNLGQIYESIQRIDAAISHYQAALEYQPDNAQLAYRLARIFVQKQQT